MLLIFFLLHFQFIEKYQSCSTNLLPIFEPFKLYEDYQSEHYHNFAKKIGFQLWIMRQPLLPIKQIPITPITSNLEQFIYQIKLKDTDETFFLLYLNILQPCFYLQLKSDFFESDEQFSISDEGVWIFFQSFFDYSEGNIIFIFQNSLTKNQKRIDINQQIEFKGSLIHQIGGVCENCTIQNFNYTFSQFKGRITDAVISNELITELEINQIQSDCWYILNGCFQTIYQITQGQGRFEGQDFLTYQMPMITKQIYQLKAWFQIYYSRTVDMEVTLFRISNNYNEKSSYYNKAVFLNYKFSTNLEETQYCLNSLSYDDFSNGEILNYTFCQKDGELYKVLSEWHYLLLDVGNNNNINLSIYSPKSESLISKSLPCRLYTGVQNYIFVGGSYLSQNTLFGYMSSLTLTVYCEFYDYSIVPVCDSTCKTCFGPRADGCLTCREEDKRVLKWQVFCECKPDVINYFETCEILENILGMITYVEEEVFCPKKGYDVCDEDGTIICSFGYFQHNNNCIKCPHFEEFKYNLKVLCFECISNPKSFAQKLLCETDAIAYNNNPSNSFIEQNREQESVEQYKIEVNVEGIYQLRLMENFCDITNCKPGFFKSNQECKKCTAQCLLCYQEEICLECNTGYYLNPQQICQKCETCLTCIIVYGNLTCLTCPDQHYLNQNSQCIACGLYCANCRSNGFCNYCIDSQKYFISLDGINCKFCSIENCKYCFQIKQTDNQIITSYDLYLENSGTVDQLSNLADIEIKCSKCLEGYSLDLENNICIKTEVSFKNCLFGKFENSEFNCLFQENNCAKFQYCKTCSTEKCYECHDGYYSDYLSNFCYPCYFQCKKCINPKKWEIMPFYDYLSQSFSFSHSFDECCTSDLRNDYKYTCLVCKEIYFLTSRFYCQETCSDCQTCSIINDGAVCTQCLLESQGVPKSLMYSGCQQCPKNCAACTKRNDFDLLDFNLNFQDNAYTEHYKKSCYQAYETNDGSIYSIQQNIVTQCKKFKRCRQKLVYQWNLYCDYQQFINLNQESYHILQSNYYLYDFFANQIFYKSETNSIFNAFNDKAISQIDHFVNFYQGEAEQCHYSGLMLFETSAFQNIFSIKNINIHFVGKDKKVQFDYQFFQILGFTTINIVNMQLHYGYFSVGTQITQQLNLYSCSIISTINNQYFKFFFQFKYLLNLKIENLEISNIYQTNLDIFNLVVQDSENLNLAEIKITNLTIFNCVFKDINIFYVKKSGSKNQLKLQMNNVKISYTRFENGSFIKTEGDKNLKLDDFIIENLSLQNIQTKQKSILFSLPNVNHFILNNASFDTFYTNNFDSIIQCNQFFGSNIMLYRVMLWGHFFTNQVEQFYQTSLDGELRITLYNISLIQVIYNLSQFLFQVILYQDCVTIINITLLTINKTIFNGYSDSNIYFSQDTAFMHFDCQTCIFDQLLIERTISGPEISILNSQNVLITNSILMQNQDYTGRIIYPSFNCYQSKFSSFGLLMMYYIYIGQYQNVIIDNLQIIQAVSFNTPFITLKGRDIMSIQHEENIKITNSKFENSMLIVSKSAITSSIISLTSEQKCNAQFINLTFINNHLNVFIQDLTIPSSTLLMIQLQQGTIVINNSFIEENLITNSSDSILYLSALQINISNTIFQQNNWINFTNFINSIIFENSIYKQIFYESDLQKYFYTNSKGGSGYFLANQVYLNNIKVNGSFSEQGGAFYINSFGVSIISIYDSTFENTFASLLSTSKSYGGCIYVDAKVSQLTLIIQETTFRNTFSRYSGGAIYINPSTSSNSINIVNIQITDCISILSSFLDFSPSDLSRISSKILIKNIKVKSTLKGFNYFLSLLDSFSDGEANILLNNNPQFLIYYSNITFQNCTMNSEINVFFASINQCNQIAIFDTLFYSSCISNSPMIKMSIKSDSSGQILIQNMKLENFSQIKAIHITEKCQSMKVKQLTAFTCLNPNFRENQFIDLVQDSKEIQSNQQICNWQTLQYTEKVNFSLIQITQIKKYHMIIFDQILIDSVMCGDCFYGILSLIEIEKLKYKNIQLKNIKILNSDCGSYGCLSIINQVDSQALKSSLLNTNTRRLLSTLNIKKLIETMNYQILIENSQFSSNTAKYGGAICIVGIDIMISQSIFFNNTALQGGAIYYVKNESQIVFLATQVSANSARIAGGLFLYDTQMNLGNELDVVIYDNNSTLAGNDILEGPRSLALSIDGGQTLLQKKTLVNSTSQIIEQTIVNPYKVLGYSQKAKMLTFPSGTSIGTYQYFDLYSYTLIPYNLTFRVIPLNSRNEREKKLDGTSCTLKHKIVNITSQREINDHFASLSFQQINFNSTSSDYNFDDLIIAFNPNYDDGIVFRIFITCEAIKVPIFSNEPPFQILKQINDYQLLVDIKTFPCQLGQYFNSTSGICIQCVAELSQYQVEFNATSCQFRDDAKIISVQSQTIQLRPNCWRAYYYSSKIEECYHLRENCLGGWKPGDTSCVLGHIGALCEQCDLYNTRGDGKFSISSPYKCGNCSQISGNVISIILISIWTLMSILMTVSSTVEIIQRVWLGNILAAFGAFISIQDSSTAVLIKVFTNYIQIISTLTTFQLKVPPELSSSFSVVGNPIEQMAFSLDCFLVGLSDISIIYFRIIWSLLMAFSYILTFFLLLLGGGLFIKRFEFNVSMVTTALIYIFIYLQPNVIQALISLVSFRKISDITWVQGNVSYRYDSLSHKHWILSFCLPSLIIISIMIPLLMFQGVYRSKKTLDSLHVRQKWGYLYNEYKLKAYYWEFIKIIQKEFIIIALCYYEDHIPIKASLVFLFIFTYSLLTTSVQPYLTGKLNSLDIQITVVCAVSIILGSSIYTAQNNDLMEIVYPFYAIIIILNLFFLLKMIIKIALAYFIKLYESIDKFKELIIAKFGQNLKHNSRIIKFFETSKSKETRIKKRFAQLKSYLIPQARKIIKLKKKYQKEEQNKMILQQFSAGPVEMPFEQPIAQNDIIETRMNSRFKQTNNISLEDQDRLAQNDSTHKQNENQNI